MVQIITNSNGGGGGGGGASYTAGTGIEISAQNEISVDTDVVQTVGNMVTNLTLADDDHYPTALAVANAISGGGSGDVVGPASSTDGDIVLFDGATGKIIKDSGVGLSSKLDASALSNNNYGGAWENDTTHTPTKRALYDKIHTMDVEIGNKAADNTVVKLSGNQTINGTKTFGTSPVVPSKTSDATNTGTAIATEAQVYNVSEDVATINGKIPSAATSSNQLADKNYVDDSINSVTAYYITKDAQGNQWASYAELAAATTFYSGGVVRVPTKNDYTIVLDDENHDHATTRYIYNSGWEYQYTVNETALTQAQLDALNSGITAAKVTTYDGYASTISGKQDTLVSGTSIKTINGTSVLGSGNISTPDTTYTAGTGLALNNTEFSNTAPFNATNGGVKVFDFPAVNDDITDLITWLNSGGDAILKESNSYCRVTSYDGVNNEIHALQESTDARDDWAILYNSSNIVTSVSSVENKYFNPGGTATTGYVVTKTASGYEWQAPTGGIEVDSASPIQLTKIWAGTQAQYEALGSYDATTVYLTI